jgi:hypothetical protein
VGSDNGLVPFDAVMAWAGNDSFDWIFAAPKENADPSAPLGMTKGKAAIPIGVSCSEGGQQVPPLRFASVGMTLHLRGGNRTVSTIRAVRPSTV